MYIIFLFFLHMYLISYYNAPCFDLSFVIFLCIKVARDLTIWGPIRWFLQMHHQSRFKFELKPGPNPLKISWIAVQMLAMLKLATFLAW